MLAPLTVAVAVLTDNRIAPWELYEMGIVAGVFGIEHNDLADPWYELRWCMAGDRPGPAPGFTLHSEHTLADVAGAQTVIVPSVPDVFVETDRPLPPDFLDALRAAHETGARLVSLCNGAFALAAAGILDGHRATAHWSHTEMLARRHPAVEVDDSVLYVDDGQVLTSAGLSAGLDLCLHLVRRDLGAEVANQLARRFVFQAHRTGGQAQFIELPMPVTDADSLSPVLEWAGSHLHEPLTVEDLARRARMSPRHFHRRLRAATGTTPIRWLLEQRLAHARRLLESTALPVEQVSRRCGLGTATNLRRHFAKHVGVTPTAYRRAFPRDAVSGR